MPYLSSLDSCRSPVVLDTSVLINLHACQYGDRILSALPNTFIVPSIVANELEIEHKLNQRQRGFLDNLAKIKKVELHELSEDEYGLFTQLTSVSPSLDDGEAAVIALSLGRGLNAVIDEKKGRRKMASLRPSLVPSWSLDLLLHSAITSTFAENEVSEAVYFALRAGRMRIPLESADHVISLIGIDRAHECTSLPNYRDRFSVGKPALWQN